MPRRALVPFLGSALCAAAVAPLAVAAYTIGPTSRLDARIFEHLAATRHSGAEAVANTFAHLGDLGPLLAMLAFCVWLGFHFGRRREALAAVAVVAGANLTTQLLKHLLARPRFQLDFGYHQPWADAFPSGHTTAAASIAAALILVAPPHLRRPAAIAAGLLTALVGVSVVVNQWHYPSDVAGGCLVVASWALAALGVLRLSGARSAGERRRTGELSAATE